MARLKHMGAKQLERNLKQVENRNYFIETLRETFCVTMAGVVPCSAGS